MNTFPPSPGLALILEMDDTGTVTYIGQAIPGTGSDKPDWQIIRVTNATGAIRFASGNSNFEHIWDNRATITYT